MTQGPCPASHPIKIPQVMYEIMFDTRQFNNKADWPADGSQPFYWSMGDNTGYGIHGDYLFGWKGDALQKAMDTKCSGDRCAALQRQTDAKAIACTKGQTAREDIGTDVCKWLCPKQEQFRGRRILTDSQGSRNSPGLRR